MNKEKELLLSVVIPMYNAEETIVRCVESVAVELCQLDSDWEVLVIDDGAKDNSFDVLSAYLKESPYRSNIFVYRQENRGVSAARNNGLKRAKGKYIAFNDSDDRWMEGRVVKQIDFLDNHPDVALIAGLYRNINIDCDGKIVEVFIKDQLYKSHFSPTTAILRRSVLQRSGLFNEAMTGDEDQNFFNHILMSDRCFLIHEVYAESILQKLSWGDTGLSSKLWTMEKGELMNIREIYTRSYCSLGDFVLATVYSYIKYLRRCVLSFSRKYLR